MEAFWAATDDTRPRNDICLSFTVDWKKKTFEFGTLRSLTLLIP